jgi:hypothetical protein
MDAFFEQLGERSVRLALQSRMRFPMPFGEYHAAMWLARRNWERREQANRLRRPAPHPSAVALERGAQFATGAAMVALFALAFDALLG